jgi:putative spermidine/putrescine transport system permease protein
VPPEGSQGLPFTIKFAAVAIAGTVTAIVLALQVYEMPRRLLVLGAIVAVVAGLGTALMAAVRGFPASRAMLGVFVAAVFVYLLLPNVVVIPISFTRHPVFLSFPGHGFTLDNFASYFGVTGAGHFKAGGWIGPTLISLEVAVLVVIISIPIGSIAAYGLSRGHFPARNLVRSLLVAPLIVPTIITAVALLLFMSKYARFMLGSAVMVGPIPVPLGLVAAHCILAIPFVVTILSANFHGLDQSLEHAAQSLGAGRLTVLYRVVLPLMAPGIAAAAFFAFLTSFDEIIIAMFLSTPAVSTLPKRMWDAVRFEVDPTIAAISTLLVVLTVVALGVAAASQRALARRQLS